ncbi:MAG TPA: hypothetical protein ENI17_14325 [Pseudomonas xinjiangensis]|uniref:Uncharacterized protein n=2 Tax=root TaxID=1 RepID=A0A7V1BR32_9GAMM|nr:hypothetical protein [Halopseudomonas xinjiangensis]HEC48784.1 hypothetical protein [Halopseudomonas xinjiangensis]
MSPLLIGALVAGGILILLSIGFISHGLERARLERARQAAELGSRIRYCETISSQLPGQFMSAELKNLLLVVQQHLLEQLVRLDRRNDKATTHLSQVRLQLASTETTVSNPPVTIGDEAQAKEARLLLENLHKLLTQASHDGLLDKTSLHEWSRQIQRYIVMTSLDMFQALARQGLQQGKPRVAKLQYERAIAYLQKQNDPAYNEHLASLRYQLNEAEVAAAQSEQTADAQSSELVAGLDALKQDDDGWKKKAVYDD